MKPWKPSPPVQNLLKKIIEITHPKQLILFGSRAKGDYRINSDVDLCIVQKSCNENLWNNLLISIQDDPYTLLNVDLVEFESLTKPYQDEIKKYGVILYEPNTKLSNDSK